MLPMYEITTSVGTGGPGTNHYRYIKGWRQARPYNLVTSFREQEATFTRMDNATYGPGRYADRAFAVLSDGDSRIQNITYSKFINKLHGAQSDIGILFGELKSSREMINKRAEQLWRMAVALKRRDFVKASKEAGLIVDSSKAKFRPKKSAQDMSSLWLEYSWGWSPMIEDIYKSLKVLVETDFDTRYLRAGTSQNDNVVTQLTQVKTSYIYAGCLNTFDWDESMSTRLRCTTGATVSVSNPNLALANRLGVINPAGVVWAVQPFSFIVDKYINIGQMLNSFSDLYGFHISNAWTAWSCKGTFDERYYADTVCNGNTTYVDARAASGLLLAKIRAPGLLGPTLAFRVPSIGSLSEAASYIALVVQLLTR